MEKKTAIELIAQLTEVKSTRDGGAKIVFTCGADSLKGIQELMKLSMINETMFAMALVRYDEPTKELSELERKYEELKNS